jgi:hypothetical protein
LAQRRTFWDEQARRRKRGTGNYLHYYIGSCSEDEGQETRDEYVPRSDGETDSEDEETQVTDTTRLTLYPRPIPPDFFCTVEARMEQDYTESQAASRFGQRTIVDPGEIDLSRRANTYDALGLEHEPENCPDLRYV